MEERKCLECKGVLFGRIDKKFCSDQCRNAYNNQLKREANNTVRTINNRLRKNRNILFGLNPSGTSRVHKDRLTTRGFHFKFFTHTHITKAGKTYYFCYDQGYVEIGNDFYALVVKEPKI
ncbi:MAG: hypothetical protein ACFB10_25555 [Salibacteraceae bacterium]